MKKQSRILWILNHTTLMEWEVPMLINNGFEVYVPKLLPVGPNSRTAKVTDEYDATLSIPKKDLEYLNAVNFYENNIPSEAAQIMNRYFGNCICAYIFPGLYYVLKTFQGKLFMRAFGHAGDMDYERATTTVPNQSLELSLPKSALQRLRRSIKVGINRTLNPAGIKHHNVIMDEMYSCKNRCYLAAAYSEILSNESHFLKTRGLFMPLALPPSILKHTDSWTGGDERVLFVCPNIDQIDYYARIYRQFKAELGTLPHAIAGRQSLDGVEDQKKTQDSSILGYISRDELDRYMKKCSAMFYHSQEPRHLHYHPLEAIVTGLPLVFMDQGLLEKLGGSDQPGLCRTYSEAREKLERLVSGDKKLAMTIQDRQRSILNHFDPHYCESEWKKSFIPLARKAA
jgi:hypothetical protein